MNKKYAYSILLTPNLWLNFLSLLYSQNILSKNNASLYEMPKRSDNSRNDGTLRRRLLQTKETSLVPNWNFSSAQGPNTYQYLANSFAFVLKQPANTEEWDMGEHEYSLFTIQRGTPEMICPSFSGVSIESSEVDLEPFVGKAVLVTGFTKNESSGSIHIELDNAVNEKRAEYEQACPFPFQRMSEYMNGNP